MAVLPAVGPRSWIGFCSVLFALAACSEPGPVFAPLADLEAGGSWVLALPDGGDVRFLAADAEGFSPESFELDPGRPAEAFLYAAPLATLRIPQGELTVTANGKPLPAPVRRVQLSFDSEGRAAWTEVATSTELDALRIDLISPCRSFEFEVIQWEPGRLVMFEPLPDGRVVMGRLLRSGEATEIAILDANGARESLGQIEDPPVHGGFAAGDTLWLAGGNGRVRYAPVDAITETSTLPPAASGQDLHEITARRVDDEWVVTVLAPGGNLDRFERGAWRTLYAQPFFDDDLADTLLLEDGEVLSVTPIRRAVVTEKDGIVAEEGLVSGGGPRSLGHVRGRTFVGMTEGEILERVAPGRWQSFSRLSVQVDVLSFLEIEGGFLVGGEDSTLVEWNDELGAFCPPIPLEGGGGVHFLVHGQGRIFAGARPIVAGLPIEVRILRAPTR